MKKTAKRSKRDYTKYVFLGKKYGKAQLVRAVVSKYAETHPKATIETLQTVFPKKEIHSVFEVVVPVKKAVEGRFFLNSEDIIKTANAKAAVSTQWTKDSIESFIGYVKKNLGMKIQHRMAA